MTSKIDDYISAIKVASFETLQTLLPCLECLVPQVIQWATHHKDDPPPPEDDDNREKKTDDIEPWDQEFLKVDQGTLFELILVSL